MSSSRAFTIWLTGLPKSGKRTLAVRLADALQAQGRSVEVIDSGKLRRTPLGATLGFSKGDRDTNVKRHAFAARLLAHNGVIAIVSAVSPYRATRDAIRAELGAFVEVWVDTPKAVCIERDNKGTWAKALRGEIRNFTGVDDPYEAPLAAEARVDLSTTDADTAVATLMTTLDGLGLLLDQSAPSNTEDQELLKDLGYSD